MKIIRNLLIPKKLSKEFVNGRRKLHWSLIIICHPGEVMNFADEELELSLKVPCILHMDSIKGNHRGLETCIKSYLWEEWKERNNDASKKISKKFFDLRFLLLEVPQQENSYDCGLFMLHYMELFVKQASNNFNPLNNFVNTDWFQPEEASLKRVRIKRLIFELTKGNAQQFASPKSSFELKDEDDEEEEADVQILDETCKSKEACCERISDTCVNKSSDVPALSVKPLRSEDMDINLLDNDIYGRSLIADIELKNHGQMVLYDPSNDVTSPIKEINETENFVGKQIVVPKTNKINPIVTCINKSLNTLQLKDESAGDDNVIESHVVEDSDDEVFEAYVVADSDSDNDSGDSFICNINNNYRKASVSKDVAEIGLNEEASKRRQKQPLVSVARKRLRKSS